MSTTPSPPAKPLGPTKARVAALREVLGGNVFYVVGSGTFYLGEKEVKGPARRTYAALRSAGLTTGGGQGVRAPMVATPKGERVASEWGLISQ